MTSLPPWRSRPISIGARWTLRNVCATFILVGILSLFFYSEIDRQLLADGQLVLRIQSDEIAGAVEHHQDAPEVVNAYINQHISSADPSLRLTIELFDEAGQLWMGDGERIVNPEPLPVWRPTSDGDRLFYQFDRGDPYPYLATVRSTTKGLVRASIYADRYRRTLDEIRNQLLVALPTALLLASVLGWWLARGSLRPIATITDTARRIRTGDSRESIPTSGSGDELDRLAVTLNEMMARIHRDMQRMRRFSTDAAHELRTPLSLMRSNVEVVLERDRSAEAYRRALRDTIAQVEHMAAGVEALLTLSRSESGLSPERKVDVALAPLIRSVAEFFEPIAAEKGIELHCRPLPEAELRGEPVWLHQLVSNLLHNALRYTPNRGRIEVGLYCENGCAEISVADTGPGIPTAERERIFERFYRGEADRGAEGMGLGLSLVHEIARAHGGCVTVEDASGGGALFRVTLPLDSRRDA